MFVCMPTSTRVVTPRWRKFSSSVVPMNALLTDFCTTNSPGKRLHLFLYLDAGLPRPERRLGLARQVLHVHDRASAVAPGVLQPGDIALEVWIVPVIPLRVDVHSFLDVDDQEDGVFGERRHVLASGSGLTGARAGGPAGCAVSARPPASPSARRSLWES